MDESGSSEALEVVERELGSFNPELLERQRLVVGTKLDAAVDRRRTELRQVVEARGLPYFEISAVSGAGVKGLLDAIRVVLARGEMP